MSLTARLAEIIVPNLTRAYPHQLAVSVDGDHQVAPARQLTPIFFGCFDWHSAVHSHWALVRLRGAVDDAARATIDDALDRSFEPTAAAAERRFLDEHPRFELPYGLAWLLTLTGELRIVGPVAARWLTCRSESHGVGALPALPVGRGRSPLGIDRSDGKLVHWDGLNLSRAWMLDTIAAALPAADPRIGELRALAASHGAAGVAALDDLTYAGSHWLPSFAVYWLTARAGSG